MKHLLFIFLWLMACTNSVSKNEEDQLRSKLLGCWGALDSEKCLLEFSKDTLFFHQSNSRSPYILRKDTILIADTSNKFSVYSWFDVRNDSLILFEVIEGDTLPVYAFRKPDSSSSRKAQ